MFSNKIIRVKARQIFDSRGNPTVQADVQTDIGVFRAAVPSGASTGKYEALQLRDNNKSFFLGRGVLKAVNNVNTIINDALIGWDPTKQKQIDKLMVEQLDGTQNQFGWCKNKLGANAILAVSLAVARAGAATKKMPLYKYIRTLTTVHNDKQQYMLPCPAFNVINGGKHGGNGLAIQEFMILPTGATSFSHAMQVGAQVYQHLMKIIKIKYGLAATNVGDEGGFVPNVNDGNEALDLLRAAIESSGHATIVQIGMDCAASEFYSNESKSYDLHFKEQSLSKSVSHLSNKQLNEIYEGYVKVNENPIVSIEDPFDQDDWQGWAMITSNLGQNIQIVGDDLLVTNKQRIQQAIKRKACNALLLKVNQIGTLSESIEAAEMSRKQGWGVMVSHRSGQTEDTFIADLVVGLGCGQIKTGAPCRSQRLAKYNQLLRIEEQLGQNGVYAGKKYRFPYDLIKQ